MAVEWGAFSGHMRVGIDIRTAGSNPMDLYIDVWVQCEGNWNFSDNQHVSLRGSAAGDWDFFNSLGANQTQLIGTVVIANQGRSYGGGPNYSFTATLTGNYLGTTSSASRGYTLPALPPGVPNPPSSGPAWSAVTAVSATLTWGATTDAHGSTPDADELQVSRNSGFTDIVYDNTGPGNSRSVTGLAPGTKYWSRSRIHNGVGWSGWSVVTTGTTGAFATSAPTVSDLAPDAATVNWTAPSGGSPTRYEVQVAKDSAFTSGVQTVSGATWALTRRVSGLSPGTGYFARVRSGTSTGFGSWSPATPFTTTSFVTSAPTFTDVAPDAATVNWATPAGTAPTGFELQVAKDAAFTSGLQTFTSPTWATSYRLTGLVPASRYYVRVRSNTATGYGAYSPASTLDTLSGAKVRKNGVWVDAPAYARVGGVWKTAKVWKRVNGVWVL